jgi:serine/arginine repetitive matrix protein 2
MPLLGRLFAKKTKASLSSGVSSNDQAATPALESPTAASDSNHSSRTLSSYVSPDPAIPSYPNAKNLVGVLRENGPATSPSSASSSSSFIKLRLFGRKKSSPAVLDIAGSASDISSRKGYSTPQRPADPLVSSMETDSSDLRRLRPPPSRSAIFAAYADSGSALSTRSLPEDPYQNSDSSRSVPSPQKRPSLFAWTKSTSSLKSPDESSDSVADSSFNLKSFRHIRVPSPPIPDSPSGNGFNSTSISRPRGSSVHSDTSQRISVAAFREAQARRSNNASPISSPRDMSQMTSLPPSRTRTPDVPHLGGPKVSRSSAALLQGGNQRLSSAIASTTDEDSSSGDDSDNDSVYKGRRNVHLPPKAKSDLGHGSTAVRSQFRNNEIPPLPRAPKSHLGHSPLGPSSRPVTHFETRDIANRTEMFPRSQSSLGVYNDTVRKGASASGSSERSALIHKPSGSIGSSSTTTGEYDSCDLNLSNSD